jgi:hypothetical protein
LTSVISTVAFGQSCDEIGEVGCAGWVKEDSDSCFSEGEGVARKARCLRYLAAVAR